MTIGKQIQILRKQRGMTQEDLSAKLGFTRSCLCNYETGRRQIQIKDLEKIASFFGVGLDHFGVAQTDDLLDLIARSKRVFLDPNISKEKKENLYKEIMRLYLTLGDE